ncbi:hypothetical protein [Shimia sediminis]|uniref:hypothetical protein n=1 Tax=Shimia sediminis TaxID=2497945 RepID=UPI000F8C7F94|nr:hypothetical protein [Shimia sediminis]
MSAPVAESDSVPPYSTRAFLWGSEREFPTREYKRRLLDIAGHQGQPAKAGDVTVVIGRYKHHGESLVSWSTCRRLTAAWSKSLCEHGPRGWMQELPRQFTILGATRAEALRQKREILIPIQGAPEAVSFCSTRFDDCMTEVNGTGVFAAWRAQCRDTGSQSCRMEQNLRARAVARLVRDHMTIDGRKAE